MQQTIFTLAGLALIAFMIWHAGFADYATNGDRASLIDAASDNEQARDIVGGLLAHKGVQRRHVVRARRRIVYLVRDGIDKAYVQSFIDAGQAASPAAKAAPEHLEPCSPAMVKELSALGR
jgi:hypothetical protein